MYRHAAAAGNEWSGEFSLIEGPSLAPLAAGEHGTAASEPLLRVRKLEAGYGDVQVLWGVDVDVPEGAVVSLVGPNGAGKTTLLLALSGMLKRCRGRISFAGQEITGWSPDQIVAAGIAHVPEGRRLFKTLSVRDNLLLGAYHRHGADVLHDLELVYSIFPILKERSAQDATTLSGGEQQMCAIARGIMARPKLLIIDELSLGLAPGMVEVLAESLLKVKAQGVTILLVEQDVITAFEISDYGYVLDSGRIGLHGPSCDLLRQSTLRNAFLGI
jgi:branched-chain amino acid transport system ATP-binding protein